MDDHKKAVALRYDKEADNAPKVLAKGRGLIADRIVSIARESGVPIYPDGDLVKALEALDINIEIPEELYRSVAEVLVFIYDLNKKLTPDQQNSNDATATTKETNEHQQKLQNP